MQTLILYHIDINIFYHFVFVQLAQTKTITRHLALWTPKLVSLFSVWAQVLTINSLIIIHASSRSNIVKSPSA